MELSENPIPLNEFEIKWGAHSVALLDKYPDEPSATNRVYAVFYDLQVANLNKFHLYICIVRAAKQTKTKKPHTCLMIAI